MARWIADDDYRLAEWETDLSSQTGASQAGILLGLERRHPRVPLGREGERADARVLLPLGLRRDRGPPRDGDRAADRRRREPRQPALRRGRRRHPHRQPHRGRAQGQPGLPRLPRQRLQRHPRARALPVGDRARGDGRDTGQAPRRAAARPPRRHLSGDAGGDVRGRPRPHRLRRPDRHDARPPRGLRDVLQLRRGRPPLRADARRHARGAAQARPAVRPPRRRPALRPAPVRDRRALRPRPDPGRDVQAAQRLRARRAGRALARRARTSPASPTATSRTRWSATRSARRRAARRRSARRTTSAAARSSSWAPGTSGSST